MKKLKHIIVLLTLAAIALCACSRETPLQRALSTIKSEFGIDLKNESITVERLAYTYDDGNIFGEGFAAYKIGFTQDASEIGRRKTTGLNVAVFIQSGIFRRTGNGNFVVTAAVYDKTAFHAEFFERLCDRFDQSRVVNADDGIDLARQNGVELPAAPDGTPFAYKSENQGLNRVFLLYYSTENTAYLITLDA